MASARYAAFISYNHRDTRIAAWLQRALERYRFPVYLRGRTGNFGPVPYRLGMVFRDREDMGASADLAASVRAAVAASDAMIVICSPAAAESNWVNQEIALFKAHAGETRVFALIVSGEPFADDIPGRDGEECLPPALRRHVRPDGAIGEASAHPLAANLRPHGDGARMARLKLLAGLAGIPLDMLVRREHARRQRYWTALAGAGALGTALMGGLALESIRARDTARARRADAEQLVEFMLGDLRKRLDAVGRLDVLDAVAAQTMRYYAKQDLGSLRADELARRAKALRLVGELHSLRGNFPAASAAFSEAAKTTAELLARDPGNGQRVFDHAQSVYYVGDVAFKRGDLLSASRAFDDYARLADRLVVINPMDDDWRAEIAYSRSNRGSIEIAARQFAKANTDFRHAAKVMQSLAARHPENVEWRSDVADFNAWVADTERFQGRLHEALATRKLALTLLIKIAEANPLDNLQLGYLAWTHRAIGNLAMDLGDVDGAIAEYGQAQQQFTRLLQTEPDNVDLLSRVARTEDNTAQALMAKGREQEANERLQHASMLCTKLTARDPKVVQWRQTASATNLIAAELPLGGVMWLQREF